MCTKPQEGPQKLILRSDQDGVDVKFYVNGREEMVSIRYLGKEIYGIFWRQRYIRWRAEVDDIEDRGTYQKIRVEGRTYLTPSRLEMGVLSPGAFQGRAY